MRTSSEVAKKRPTIYDLATLTGASATAVSAVLNGSWKKRRISERLALKIIEVAKEQGYAVNLQASVLRRERSNIVGMIVPKYDNRYFGAMAERFEALARNHGLFPVITCTQRDPQLEIQAAQALISYQVDYLVVTGATKPATLETGYTVQVPMHISEGDTLKVDSRTGDYVERVNK